MNRDSKSAFLQVTLNFELGKMNIVVDILPQISLTILLSISCYPLITHQGVT